MRHPVVKNIINKLLKYKTDRTTFLASQRYRGFDPVKYESDIEGKIEHIDSAQGPNVQEMPQQALDTSHSHNLGVVLGIHSNVNKSMLLDSSTALTTECQKTLSHIPKFYFAGSVNAETGLYQYGQSALPEAHINKGRPHYTDGILSSIYFHYLAKVAFSGAGIAAPKSIGISHSWGSPAFLQEYSYSLSALIKRSEPDNILLQLPHDALILVDPRFPSSYGHLFAKKIEFIRSLGVKVFVVKDKSYTKGFGAINNLSGIEFHSRPSSRVDYGDGTGINGYPAASGSLSSMGFQSPTSSRVDYGDSTEVDGYQVANVGHAYLNHTNTIERYITSF
jgi:hypothetical protein